MLVHGQLTQKCRLIVNEVYPQLLLHKEKAGHKVLSSPNQGRTGSPSEPASLLICIPCAVE